MRQDDDQETLSTAWRNFRRGQPRWYARGVIFAVTALSRHIMQRLNHLQFEGMERFEAALARRDAGLLTFSNHVALLDDPWLIACFGSPSYERQRWVAADARNFFSNSLKGLFFSAGKCVPLVRGLGLDQPGFAFLIDRLKAGDWVHIFPEGGRTRQSGTRLKTPFKQGIGKLIDEAEPWVLPFYHLGMEAILPVGRKLPSRGRVVSCKFGESERLDRARITTITHGATDARERVRRLTQWAQSALEQMERTYRPIP